MRLWRKVGLVVLGALLSLIVSWLFWAGAVTWWQQENKANKVARENCAAMNDTLIVELKKLNPNPDITWCRRQPWYPTDWPECK